MKENGDRENPHSIREKPLLDDGTLSIFATEITKYYDYETGCNFNIDTYECRNADNGNVIATGTGAGSVPYGQDGLRTEPQRQTI